MFTQDMQPGQEPMKETSQAASQGPQTMQQPVMKTKFGEVFKEAYRIYKQSFVGLTGLFLGAGIIMAGLSFSLVIGTAAMLKNKSDMGIFIAVIVGFAVVQWLVGLFGTIAVLRGAATADSGKFSMGEAFSTGLSKLGKAIELSVRVFFYTGAWAILILAVISMGGMLLSFFGIAGTAMGQQAVAQWTSMFGPLVWMAPLLMILLIIFLIRRFLSVVFAFPVLMSADDVSAKEALKKSIELSRNKTGTIFSNYFLYGIVMAILTAVVVQILAQIVDVAYPYPSGASADVLLSHVQTTNQIAGLLPSLVVGTFNAVFQYAFMKKMKEEKGL